MTREQAIEKVVEMLPRNPSGTTGPQVWAVAEAIVDALGIGQPEVIQHNADWQRDGSLSPGQPEADVELTLAGGESLRVENTSDRTIVVAAPTSGTFDIPGGLALGAPSQEKGELERLRAIEAAARKVVESQDRWLRAVMVAGSVSDALPIERELWDSLRSALAGKQESGE